MESVEISSVTPILNTPDFRFAFGGVDGRQIPTNALGHPRYYEFVAMPSMRFQIEEVLPNFIYRVSTPSYLSKALYVDSRFTHPAQGDRFFHPLPSLSEIAARMKRLLGTKYVWGGNWSAGIADMLKLYPPRGPIDERTLTLWTLKGVDCSGLLYEATGGLTPRNTSGLIHFGQTVPIAGKTAQQILRSLQPMDIVVWPGHVWYVYDLERSIESKSKFGGVVHRPLLERLEMTLQERRPVDFWKPDLDSSKHFVIRRIKFG